MDTVANAEESSKPQIFRQILPESLSTYIALGVHYYGSVALLSHFAKCKNWMCETKKYKKISMAQNA